MEPEPSVEAEAFESGVAKDTEGGAFRVILEARSDLELGSNDLIARVGFHDPADPTGPGFGVPSAEVMLDAYQVDGDGYVDGIIGSHIGEGRYEFNDVQLDDVGVWQLEFSIAVGATIDESVGFTFEISE